MLGTKYEQATETLHYYIILEVQGRPSRADASRTDASRTDASRTDASHTDASHVVMIIASYTEDDDDCQDDDDCIVHK